MAADRHVFCGKCGKPNPADNQFCRSCGHRLADDVVELDDAEIPANPVPEVELQRFPLVDPTSGENLPVERPPRPTVIPQGASRTSTILGSVGIHFFTVSLVAIVTLAVLAPSQRLPSSDDVAAVSGGTEDISRRREAGELDDEQAAQELIGLFERHGITRLQTLLSGPILLAFFISGLICGRLFRPAKLLDVGLSGVLFGGFSAIFLMSPLIFPLAFGLCLLGAMMGRRWR